MPILEKCRSPVTTTAARSIAVAAIIASARDIPEFFRDPADKAIGILTGMMVRPELIIVWRRISASLSLNRFTKRYFVSAIVTVERKPLDIPGSISSN